MTQFMYQLPAKVFVFSGHLIDAPDRERERLPESMTDIAAAAIARKLDEVGAGERDLALCEGACGGDLLFAAAVLERKMRLELRLPFAEAEFLEESIAYAGQQWIDRFTAVKSHARTSVFEMPAELGPTPSNVDPYERANLWQVEAALTHASDRVQLIALWDGERSQQRGGTEHMVHAMRERGGRIEIIDARDLLRCITAATDHGGSSR
jgi:hypothetical protein